MNKSADRPFNAPLHAVPGFAPLGKVPAPGLGRDCGCDVEKIQTVHRYLAGYFPHYSMRDLHAPSRRFQEGLLQGEDEQHVVRIAHPGVLPYYAILLPGFLRQPLDHIREQLLRWSVADAVRRNRIAIISADGPSPL